MICRICGNGNGNVLHVAREMMYGSREEFEYMECGACGCLQIGSYPEDVSRYYRPDYYSFARKPAPAVKAWLNRHRDRHVFFGNDPVGALYGRVRPARPLLERLGKLGLRPDSEILDVGCGSGALLLDMHGAGFRSLTGIDAFVEGDTSPAPGVRIIKAPLDRFSGSFDLVMLHHSLEHMPNQREQMVHIHRMVRPGGTCMIRVPLASSHAWRHYGVNWVQLDAPRHFYLHTVESMRLLGKEARFDLEAVDFDSNNFQFVGSELYARDIPLQDAMKAGFPNYFPRESVLEFERRARELNAQCLGDQGVFIFTRTQ